MLSIRSSWAFVWLPFVLATGPAVVAHSSRSNTRSHQDHNRAANLAKRSRRLEDNETFEYDLTDFSVRYEKCQYVRTFEDELAEDEDSDSPLATKHFVVYRLCPTDSCDTCETYGKYVVDVESYLEYTINYQTQAFEEMCENCNQECNGDENDDNDDCSNRRGCAFECYAYANLEILGYVDASQYIQCEQIDYGDDDSLSLYIGPRCSSQGAEITIGLFSDENCWEPYTDLDVEDFLGVKLSYLLFSHASNKDGNVCISCAEEDDDNNNQGEDDDDVDEVNEMCEGLYAVAGKCESKTGISGGFVQTNEEDQDYENQVENEFMTCTFIDSLIWNSYTETGEIDTDSDQDEIIRQITTMQTGVLTLLGLTILSLVGSIVYLHRKIEARFPNLTFMCHSDHQFT